ncbi:MAG: anthranilate synthase component I family protein, partial [Steroidobacteraceae bacterium]|nr:anthranilate synthase component I family protein [Steroidobacteraceae bacterium]
MAWRMRAALLLDHDSGRLAAVAESGAEDELERLCADWKSAAPLAACAWTPPAVTEDDPQRYLEACRRALEHIAAGDIYQANLARGWRARLPPGVTAPALHARLRRANPGAFAGIAQFDGLAVLSSSPERLVRVRGRRIDTRPIAGTRPRAGVDAEAIAAMTGSAKERAEHVMLIDLARNDIGRIAEIGTVRVTDQLAIEKYSHVMHIVSNVEGKLKPGMGPIDVLRATFPAGTLSGAPKIRAMEIIDELEPTKRGIYGGACGYISFVGDLDLAIAIRTAVVKDGTLYVEAAAGVVADSIP